MKKLLTPQKYKAQVIKAKDEILRFVRNRLVAETRNATALGSVDSEEVRTFLEQFMQELTVEERYFFRISVIDTLIQVLIFDSTEFLQHLSPNYQKCD